MDHFLLIFERTTGRLEIEKFSGPQAGRIALRARFAAESRFAGQHDIELVVIQAKSENEIKKTHSRYFQSASQLTQAAREDLLATAS